MAFTTVILLFFLFPTVSTAPPPKPVSYVFKPNSPMWHFVNVVNQVVLETHSVVLFAQMAKMSKNKKKKMKKKQKKQAEMLEKRIQEMEGGVTPEGCEDEDDEDTTETTTETTEDTTSLATLSMSTTLQDITNHTITGERPDPVSHSDGG